MVGLSSKSRRVGSGGWGLYLRRKLSQSNGKRQWCHLALVRLINRAANVSGYLFHIVPSILPVLSKTFAPCFFQSATLPASTGCPLFSLSASSHTLPTSRVLPYRRLHTSTHFSLLDFREGSGLALKDKGLSSLLSLLYLFALLPSFYIHTLSLSLLSQNLFHLHSCFVTVYVNALHLNTFFQKKKTVRGTLKSASPEVSLCLARALRGRRGKSND